MTTITLKTINTIVILVKSPTKNVCARILKELGGAYPLSVGINLDSMVSKEVFKWFIASILLGVRIDEDIAAMNTYRVIEKSGILTVKSIIETGRAGLLKILNQSGYVKYNYKTATK